MAVAQTAMDRSGFLVNHHEMTSQRLRLRFTLNRSALTESASQTRVKKNLDTFAQTVVEDVGVAYAQGEYEKLKSKIEGQVRRIVRRELKHLTMLYKQFIVGAVRVGRGTVTTEARDAGSDLAGNAARGEALSSMLPLPWAARSKKYLERKGSRSWFELSGYLGQQMNPENWQAMFGPIIVKVQPIKSHDHASGRFDPTQPTAFATKGKVMRFGVAKISVSVFGQITPAMIPGIIDGDLSGSRLRGIGTVNPLLGLVSGQDEKLAYHLGGRTKYRPSLEPFLGFAITRSVPAAMYNALVEDLGDGLGAGKTRARE